METDKELSDRLTKMSEKLDTLNALLAHKKRTLLEKQFMLWTTVVAFFTAAASLGIIYWMSSGLDNGLGLAAIGIITFFGVSLSSSIFEEHRHDHKPKQNAHFISNVIVGTGIMRKGLAASLVITYIVLIGFSFSAGTLDNPLDGGDDQDTNSTGDGDNTNSTGAGDVRTQSPDININLENIGITNIREYDKIQIKKTNQSSNSIEELILEKEPSTLVEHFTIVISVVIGFYFGSNTLAALLKARKEDKTSEDSSDILEVIDAKGKITKEESDKKKKDKED